MQPITPPDYILLMHQEMVDAELARRSQWQPEQTSLRHLQPLRAIRVRLGHALVAIGTRIDPTARRVSRPVAG